MALSGYRIWPLLGSKRTHFFRHFSVHQTKKKHVQERGVTTILTVKQKVTVSHRKSLHKEIPCSIYDLWVVPVFENCAQLFVVSK